MLITALVKQFELQQLEKQYLIRSHCILYEAVFITAHLSVRKQGGLWRRARGPVCAQEGGLPTVT